MHAATGLPPSYFESLAEEIESIANSIRTNPQLNKHFADRLMEIAKELRRDSSMLRLGPIRR